MKGIFKLYIRHEIGKQGEELARKYLLKKGYNIIEKNFMARQGEIDIIALDKDELVFIEVKTRTNQKYGKPASAVDYNKRKHMINTIKYYLYSRGMENQFVRIDIIEVYLYNNKFKINHLKQVKNMIGNYLHKTE